MPEMNFSTMHRRKRRTHNNPIVRTMSNSQDVIEQDRMVSEYIDIMQLVRQLQCAEHVAFVSHHYGCWRSVKRTNSSYVSAGFGMLELFAA